MATEIRLRDFRPNQLNNKCLRLVGQFAREAKRLDGQNLRLQDQAIMLRISRYARATRHQSLKNIYQLIKRELAAMQNSKDKQNSDAAEGSK